MSNNYGVPNFFDVKKDVLKMQLTKILKLFEKKKKLNLKEISKSKTKTIIF